MEIEKGLLMKSPNLIIVCLCLWTTAAYAQKDCTNAKQKLHNHQQKMRQGYTAKNAEALRVKERKLFNDFHTCLNSPSTLASQKKANSKKKKTKNIIDTNTAETIRWQQGAIAFSGKFSGAKQKAWLLYYKQPKQCGKPKSTQVFAWYTEHKTKSSEVFSELWQSTNKQ